MKEEKESIIKKRTYEFALKIIDVYKMLKTNKEYVISKQLLKAGTSIGANVEEALAGQSRADFLSKMSIASKEARETNYWLRLIMDSKFLEGQNINTLITESAEIIRMLTAIVKTTAIKNSAPSMRNSQLKTKNL